VIEAWTPGAPADPGPVPGRAGWPARATVVASPPRRYLSSPRFILSPANRHTPTATTSHNTRLMIARAINQIRRELTPNMLLQPSLPAIPFRRLAHTRRQVVSRLETQLPPRLVPRVQPRPLPHVDQALVVQQRRPAGQPPCTLDTAASGPNAASGTLMRTGRLSSALAIVLQTRRRLTKNRSQNRSGRLPAPAPTPAPADRPGRGHKSG